MNKSFLTLFSIIFIVVGCEINENQATVIQSIFSDPLIGNSCSVEDDGNSTDEELINLCEAQEECQKVLDEEDKYLGCIPSVIPDEEDEPKNSEEEDEENNSNENDDDRDNEEDNEDEDNDSDDLNEDEDEDEEENDKEEKEEKEHACSDPTGNKNHKVLVCHHNKGKKKHITLCVAKKSWHSAFSKCSKHKKKNYLGACRQKDLD